MTNKEKVLALPPYVKILIKMRMAKDMPVDSNDFEMYAGQALAWWAGYLDLVQKHRQHLDDNEVARLAIRAIVGHDPKWQEIVGPELKAEIDKLWADINRLPKRAVN